MIAMIEPNEWLLFETILHHSALFETYWNVNKQYPKHIKNTLTFIENKSMTLNEVKLSISVISVIKALEQLCTVFNITHFNIVKCFEMLW